MTRKTTKVYEPVPDAAHEYAEHIQEYLEKNEVRTGATNTAAYMGFVDGLAAALKDPAWARKVVVQAECDNPGTDAKLLKGARLTALWTVIEKFSLRRP